jgi:ribosome recycling factor
MMSSARWLLQTEKVAMQRIGARSIAPAQMALRFAFADPQVAGRTAYTATRAYHSTALAMAKAKKSGGGKKGGDEEEVEATLPDLSHTRKKMEMVVDRFSQEMAKVKVGRASVDMFSDIQVGSYGSVSSAGQVTVKTASSINIAVYDPSMVKTVADAIKDCGMGFSPTVENSNITVFVPKPSKESRDVLIKAASRSAEKVRYLHGRT